MMAKVRRSAPASELIVLVVIIMVLFKRNSNFEGSPEQLPHQCGIDGIVEWERKTVLDRDAA